MGWPVGIERQSCTIKRKTVHRDRHFAMINFDINELEALLYAIQRAGGEEVLGRFIGSAGSKLKAERKRITDGESEKDWKAECQRYERLMDAAGEICFDDPEITLARDVESDPKMRWYYAHPISGRSALHESVLDAFDHPALIEIMKTYDCDMKAAIRINRGRPRKPVIIKKEKIRS